MFTPFLSIPHISYIRIINVLYVICHVRLIDMSYSYVIYEWLQLAPSWLLDGVLRQDTSWKIIISAALLNHMRRILTYEHLKITKQRTAKGFRMVYCNSFKHFKLVDCLKWLLVPFISISFISIVVNDTLLTVSSCK